MSPAGSWHPALRRGCDHTGTAHRMGPGGGPACGARVYALGGGFPTPEAGGCRPCRRCAGPAPAPGTPPGTPPPRETYL